MRTGVKYSTVKNYIDKYCKEGKFWLNKKEKIPYNKKIFGKHIDFLLKYVDQYNHRIETNDEIRNSLYEFDPELKYISKSNIN